MESKKVQCKLAISYITGTIPRNVVSDDQSNLLRQKNGVSKIYVPTKEFTPYWGMLVGTVFRACGQRIGISFDGRLLLF
jgi:hypothetical protein